MTTNFVLACSQLTSSSTLGLYKKVAKNLIGWILQTHIDMLGFADIKHVFDIF